MMKHKWLGAIFLSTICTTAFAGDFDDFVTHDHITKWEGSSYSGMISLGFDDTTDRIRAQLETDDLTLVSITADQLENYINLFTNSEAVSKYGDGQPWTRDEVEEAVLQWTERWEVSRDPFSAFAIYDKKSGNAFIGHIVLGHGSRYGQSELAFLFNPAFQHIELATQAVSAVLYGYVPRLLEGEYLVNLNNSVVDPSPLRSIHGTGHFDDVFSGQAMIRSGMKIGESDLIWGAQRFHYLIRVDDVLDRLFLQDYSLFETGD